MSKRCRYDEPNTNSENKEKIFETNVKKAKTANNIIQSFSYTLTQLLNHKTINKDQLKTIMIEMVRPDVRIAIKLTEKYCAETLNDTNKESFFINKDLELFNLLKETNHNLDDCHQFDVYVFKSFIYLIDSWFDINGDTVYEEANIELSEFSTLELDSSLYLNHSNIEDGCEFFLALWPKRHQIDTMIKLETKNYIYQTYKELLADDSDLSVDDAISRVDKITKELIINAKIDLDENNIYYLFELFKLGQNEYLVKCFIESDLFSAIFKRLNINIVKCFYHLMKEYNFNTMVDINQKLMMVKNHKLCVQSYCMFIQYLVGDDLIEVAFELMLKVLIPFKPSFLSNVFQVMILFRRYDKYWQKISEYMLDYSFTDIYSNAPNILKLVKHLKLNNEDDLSYLCLINGIQQALDDIEYFRALVDETNTDYLINLMKYLAIDLISKTMFQMFCRNLVGSGYKETIEEIVGYFELKLHDYKNFELIKYFIEFILNYYKDNYETLPSLNWKMPNAIFKQNKAIERFLRSNETYFIFNEIKCTDILNDLCVKLMSNIENYSVFCYVNRNEITSEPCLVINKTNHYQLQQKNYSGFYSIRYNALFKKFKCVFESIN